MSEDLTERFELKLSKAEKKALECLAVRKGISMGNVLRSMLRRAAKRAKLMP